ncbi:MAG: serine hydrolase domain-containing protein [Candidatus Aquilonibacter sp.]
MLAFCAAAVLFTPPSAIQQTLATYVKAHPYAEVAVGVIDHGQVKIYFVRGTQAKAPLDETTQFQIGSITKVFTATILAQMVDAGEMKLDDPIQRYLPAGVTAPTFQGKPITLLTLANHTSGLPVDPANLSQQNEAVYTTTMLYDALKSTKLSRAPGEKWDYSNFGFALLGQLLARKAQLSYDDLIKQRILDPLGMNDTVVTGSAATTQKMPPAFQYGGAPSQAESLGARGPAGSIESDLKDMLVFLKANLDAPQGTLGRELALTQQPRTPVKEWNMAMGLAWQTVLPATHRDANDLGDLAPGSIEKGGDTNGYSSIIALNHKDDWGVVAMTNVNDDDFQQVVEHAVSPSTARMPTMWAIVEKTTTERSPFDGTYVIGTSKRVTLDIFKYKGDLYASIPMTTPGKLRPLGRNKFSWDAVQVTLTFHADPSGHVTSLTAVQGGRTMHAKRIHQEPGA